MKQVRLTRFYYVNEQQKVPYIHDCIVVEIYTRSFSLLCDSQINYTALQNVSFSKVRVQEMTAGNLQWSTGYEGTQSPRKRLLRRLIMMIIPKNLLDTRALTLGSYVHSVPFGALEPGT